MRSALALSLEQSEGSSRLKQLVSTVTWFVYCAMWWLLAVVPYLAVPVYVGLQLGIYFGTHHAVLLKPWLPWWLIQPWFPELGKWLL